MGPRASDPASGPAAAALSTNREVAADRRIRIRKPAAFMLRTNACRQTSKVAIAMVAGRGGRTCRLYTWRRPAEIFLYAFDLLELDGQDFQREPIETRKATLTSLLRNSLPGLRLNEHLIHPGDTVFRHACKMGL